MQNSVDTESYSQLAKWLQTRHEAILSNWRNSVCADADLKTARNLSSRQLNDHIPEILDTYERGLMEIGLTGSEEDVVQDPKSSQEHGLHRWQQGYPLHELTKEWGHLNLCLLSELEQYSTDRRDLSPEIMPNARRLLAELCLEGISSSSRRYFELHKREAEGHVKDLELTLAQLNDLERRRAELWREAAHDIRGSVNVVKSASTLLSKDEGLTPPQGKYLDVLQTSVQTLHQILNSVMDLARLQAGHEHQNTADFDAARLLRDVCNVLESSAQERSLFLKCSGPETLNVQGDAAKVARIAQNIILNAIKYTEIGGVTVHWDYYQATSDSPRWAFSVTDTGPGLLAGPGAPILSAIKEATDLERQSEGKRSSRPARAAMPPHQQPGEGIGLSIVKELCNLLDANIEVQAGEKSGTIFKVIFPLAY